MAKENKSSKNAAPARKSYVGMAAITLLCIIAGFIVIRGSVFAPIVNETAKAGDADDKTASDQQPTNNGDNTATDNSSATAEGPAKVDEATDTPSSITSDDAPITPEDFTTLSVFSDETNAGYTAVFNRRGASLALLRYTDERSGEVKPLFVSTPRSPMDRPDQGKVEDSLLLLGPPLSLRPWKWNRDKEGYVAKDPAADAFTAFPEKAGPNFDRIWNGKIDGNLRPAANHRAAFELIGGDQALNDVRWELVSKPESNDTSAHIAFKAKAGDLRYEKHFTLLADYKIVCEIRIYNEGKKDATRSLSLYGPTGVRQDIRESYTHNVTSLFVNRSGKAYASDEELFASLPGELEDYNEEKGRAKGSISIPAIDLYGREEITNEHLMMNGISNGYFLASIGIDYLPEVLYGESWGNGRTGGGYRLTGFLAGEKTDEPNIHATFAFPNVSIPVGEVTKRRVVLYAGPRDKEHVEAAFAVGEITNAAGDSASWSDYLTTGWPQIISAPITWLLRLLRGGLGSMGLAILALTIIVRMLMAPLSVRGQLKMQVHAHKMRQIKPKLDELNKKYENRQSRDDKMLKFREQQAIMKSNGVSLLPLGGCLPLLLQMPIFLALYNSVRTSFLLRHETFLWMNDLSRPDALFGAWETSAWYMGIFAHGGFVTLNLLPILWAAMLVLQQMVTSTTPTDPNQARMQKQMRFIMPLMGLMFYTMPAGFTLYFVMSSLYSFIEVRLVRMYLIGKGLIDPPEKKGEEAKPKVTIEKTS